MGTLYDVMVESIKDKYFRDTDGVIYRVEGIGLHDKHSEVSMVEVLTRQSVGVDMLCIREYEKVSREDVKETLFGIERRISEEKESL
ncbi:hypothetical protein K8R30_02050 [archaeon]|nr:hypothetical protein [archaeon]